MPIPNKHLGVAQQAFNDANPGRNVLTRQRDNGQLYRENDDSGKPLPTMAELQPYYGAWLAETAPERGFDHEGDSIPYTPADCLKVLEVQAALDAGANVTGKHIQIEFSNGVVWKGPKTKFTALATAFHGHCAAQYIVAR